MPIAERGGPTTQAGILFQNSIAALYLGRLCDCKPFAESERVVEVRVEAPESVDDFVVTYANGKKQYFQVKEQIEKNSDAWKDLWSNFEKQYLYAHFQRDRDILTIYSGSYTTEIEKLKAICDRASTSRTNHEWETRLTQDLNSFLKNHIVEHLSGEIGSERELLPFFKCVKVEVTPITEIERGSIFNWMPSANVGPITLFRILRDKVSYAARLRGTFYAEELKGELTEEQIQISTLPDLEHARNLVRQCGSLLRHHKKTIGNTGIHLTRSVTEEIVQWLLSDQNERSLSLLLDQAGQGKTVLMRDIHERLERENVEVLAIKADLQLSGITSLDDFQVRLHLPDRIEQVLGRLALMKRTVVLLDQVDALSMSLSQDQQALNLLIDLVVRIQSIPGVRVLLSCRAFDFHNDPRFKNLEIEKTFSISDLSDDELNVVLSHIGVDHRRLPETTNRLIRVPLHLDLFMRVVEGKRPEEIMQLSGVSSLQELYHYVWDSVVMKSTPDAPPQCERQNVLMHMAECMNQSQRIAVSKSIFLNNREVDSQRSLIWLASEGIVLEDDRSWSFFHQTFFDYCYAKSFVEREISLVNYILNSEQGLYQRPQLIQILSYLRGQTDRVPYYQQLSHFFNTNGIRYHLRDHFFRWFGTISNPDNTEWRLLRQFTQRDVELLRKHIQFSRYNVGWFPYWKSEIGTKMNQNTHDSEIVEEIFSYLYSIIEIDQEGVIAFLTPFRSRDQLWNHRVSSFMLIVRTWKTPTAVEWLEDAVKDLTDDQVSHFYRWSEIGSQQPKALIRLIHFFLERSLSSYLRKKEESTEREECFYGSLSIEINKLSLSSMREPFIKVSETEPKYLLECFLPWLSKVMQLTGNRSRFRNCYYSDELSGGWYDEELHETTELIVMCIKNALLKLSEVDEQSFRTFISQLTSLEYTTAQQLVAIVYREKCELYANDAYLFLLDDKRRLSLGECEVYESRQLIKNIYPYLTREQQLKLEEVILEHNEIYPIPDLRVLKHRGRDQLRLLRSIPRELLSLDGKRRIMELERKFPNTEETDRPRIVEGGLVESPIPSELIIKLNDKSWLRAMDKYHGNFRHEEILKGGASELARLLREQIIDQPERFHRLLMKCPINIDWHYIDATLMGLSESNAPMEFLIECIRKFQSHDTRIVKISIARALEKRHAEGIPTDLLLFLKNSVESQEGDSDNWSDVFTAYLNSIRGVSMNAYMKAMNSDSATNNLESKWNMIQYAVDEEYVPLRAGAIFELIRMLQVDAERAINLFERALEGNVGLYDMRYTKQFCYNAVYFNCRKILPHIRVLMNSTDENVQEIAASIVTHIAIDESERIREEERTEVMPLFFEGLKGSAKSMKVGVSKVLSKKITSSTSPILFESLRYLIHEDFDEVKRNISSSFYRLKSTMIEDSFDIRNFIVEYAGSKAVSGNYNQFEQMMLEQSVGHLQEWSLQVIETLVTNEHYNTNSRWGSGESLIRLVIHIYTDVLSTDDIKTKAMNIFDRLMELFSHEAQKVLSEWDQR